MLLEQAVAQRRAVVSSRRVRVAVCDRGVVELERDGEVAGLELQLRRVEERNRTR